MRLDSLDNILIIDNNPNEVEWLVKLLNNKGISTSFITNPLNPESKVVLNPNTKLVILDLYLDEVEESYEVALSVVQLLSEKIKGPYLVIIWSKNEVDSFRDALDNQVIKCFPQKNYPVIIDKIDKTRFAKGINDPEILGHIENIILRHLENSNIDAFFSFLSINYNANDIWSFVKDNINSDDISAHKINDEANKLIGALFTATDLAFGYEDSGKGLFKFRNSLVDNNLSINPIKYTKPSGEINIDLKKKVNILLSFHKTSDRFSDYHKPGLIIGKGIDKYVPPVDYFREYFYSKSFNDCKPVQKGDGSWIYKRNEQNFYEFNLSIKYIIITAECDYSNNKNHSTLLLRALVVEDLTHDDGTPRIVGNAKEKLISNIKEPLDTYIDMQISNKAIMIYNLKEFFTIRKDIDIKFDDVEPQYLNKELLDYIRHSVSSNISRVGLSNIPIKKSVE